VKPEVVETTEETVTGTEEEKTSEAAEKTEEPVVFNFAGRQLTQADAEKTFLSSQREGKRLFTENKALKTELDQAKSKLSEFEYQSSLPKFEELSEEKLNQLKEESPAEWALYQMRKDNHERDLKAHKERMESSKKEQENSQKALKKKILDMVDQVKADPRFSDYGDLEPLIEDVMDYTGDEIAGFEWSVPVSYFAALGFKTWEARNKSGSKPDNSPAKKKAQAAAAQVSSAPATAGSRPAESGVLTDEEFNKKLIERVNSEKNIFNL